ncbi:MAG: hypothetical protein FJW40_16975 [Acidobacteria bacterium]|nr:hypothetical protein [Acidobacteriota bacterium]
MKLLFLLTSFLAATGHAAEPGSRVEYAGGTLPGLSQGADGRLRLDHPDDLAVRLGTQEFAIKWHKVNTLEYGQKADRRYVMAVVVSPMLLLSKKRRHFLTIGYEDAGGRQQALVFRVDKRSVRALLAGLEAKTGRRVEFQDEEARKAGKG